MKRKKPNVVLKLTSPNLFSSPDSPNEMAPLPVLSLDTGDTFCCINKVDHILFLTKVTASGYTSFSDSDGGSLPRPTITDAIA
jgi:hypothetical protein